MFYISKPLKDPKPPLKSPSSGTRTKQVVLLQTSATHKIPSKLLRRRFKFSLNGLLSKLKFRRSWVHG